MASPPAHRAAQSFTPLDVTGLVLAGGLGRRMGGVDKGLQAFNGRPLVASVLERLAPQVGPLLINANQNRVRYEEFGAPVIGDRIGGFAGPLAGLHAGLTACATPWLVTVPCDSPFLPRDLVARLRDGLAEHTSAAATPPLAALARCAGWPQPVFALVHRDALDSLGAYLSTGQRKAEAWFGSLDPVMVDFPDPTAFANINTAEELAALAGSVTTVLTPHATTPCPAVGAISVDVRSDLQGGLLLAYRIATNPAALRLPPPLPPGPADNLWQHTCLEAFIAGPGSRYREFNFSPSGQWAVYDFIAMRQRDDAYTPATAPTITYATDAAGLTLHARLPAALLPADGPLQLGLSAVIETTDGHLSYWALTHTEAKPDFHRRAAFTFHVPPI